MFPYVPVRRFSAGSTGSSVARRRLVAGASVARRRRVGGSSLAHRCPMRCGHFTDVTLRTALPGPVAAVMSA
jgi:hypothetical protein